MRRYIQLGLIIALLAALAWQAAPVANGGAEAIDALLRSYHDAGVFNGSALVAVKSQVILKKGYGLADFEWKIPNAPDTKFRLGSITKQFTAAVVMQLVEEKRLSLETTLSDALPYYRKDTGGRITMHHLLAHTSGIPSYTGLPNFRREISRDPYPVREFVEQYCSGELEFEPGAKFRYNNSGYFLLGAIIEQVTGKPYAEVLDERIFSKLGMTASGYDSTAPVLEKRARGYERTPTGVRNADYIDMSLPYAAGALYSTVEDLYTWDQALYDDRVLPGAARDRMFTPVLDNYAYGWMIRKQAIGPGRAETVTIGHGGGIDGFNTLIVRIPEGRRLVVLLNNTGRSSLGAIFEGVMDVVNGRKPPAPKPLVVKP